VEVLAGIMSMQSGSGQHWQQYHRAVDIIVLLL